LVQGQVPASLQLQGLAQMLEQQLPLVELLSFRCLHFDLYRFALDDCLESLRGCNLEQHSIVDGRLDGLKYVNAGIGRADIYAFAAPDADASYTVINDLRKCERTVLYAHAASRAP